MHIFRRAEYAAVEKEWKEMSNKCEICGKGPVAGNSVSHSHKKTRRNWKPNIQSKYVLRDGKKQKIKICTRCLRSDKVQAV